MKPRNLFNKDDRGVSPVIGVILMVAITVILAAVIGTFVLGLGDSLGDSQPTAQLNADIDDSGVVTISHDGGDSIDSDSLQLVFDSNGSSTESNLYASRLSVGDSFTGDVNATGSATTVNNGDDIRLRVIHEPSQSVLLDRTFEYTGTSFTFDSATDISV